MVCLVTEYFKVIDGVIELVSVLMVGYVGVEVLFNWGDYFT